MYHSNSAELHLRPLSVTASAFRVEAARSPDFPPLFLSFPSRRFLWTALAYFLDRRYLQRFIRWGLDGSSPTTVKGFPTTPPSCVATEKIANGISAFSSRRREVTLALDLIPPCLRGEVARSGVTCSLIFFAAPCVFARSSCFGQKRC